MFDCIWPERKSSIKLEKEERQTIKKLLLSGHIKKSDDSSINNVVAVNGSKNAVASMGQK